MGYVVLGEVISQKEGAIRGTDSIRKPKFRIVCMIVSSTDLGGDFGQDLLDMALIALVRDELDHSLEDHSCQICLGVVFDGKVSYKDDKKVSNVKGLSNFRLAEIS